MIPERIRAPIRLRRQEARGINRRVDTVLQLSSLGCHAGGIVQELIRRNLCVDAPIRPVIGGGNRRPGGNHDPRQPIAELCLIGGAPARIVLDEIGSVHKTDSDIGRDESAVRARDGCIRARPAVQQLLGFVGINRIAGQSIGNRRSIRGLGIDLQPKLRRIMPRRIGIIAWNIQDSNGMTGFAQRVVRINHHPIISLRPRGSIRIHLRFDGREFT